FGDTAESLTGTVNGNYWASLLSQRLGYPVSPGEQYYAPGCTSTAQCVFPGATIPSRAWSTAAQRLLKYIPAPNSGDGQFSTGAFAQTVRDDKFSGRVDTNSRLGLLNGYYFFDDYKLDNPYPGQQGGANVPGFDALTLGRAQLFTFGDNTVFGANTVNEFHIGFMRNANDVGRPNGGLGVSLASQGFVTGPGTPGIVVLAAQLEPDRELWPPLGSHRPVVRAKQSDSNRRRRAAVDCLSGCAERTGLPDRSRHRPRAVTRPVWKYLSANRYGVLSRWGQDE